MSTCEDNACKQIQDLDIMLDNIMSHNDHTKKNTPAMASQSIYVHGPLHEVQKKRRKIMNEWKWMCDRMNERLSD